MTRPVPIRPLEGPGSVERTRRLRRRFRKAQPRRGLIATARVVLVTYWLVCLSIIGVGLDRLYPAIRPTLTQSLLSPGEPAWISRGSPTATAAEDPSPTMATPVPTALLTHRFRTCAAARQAGVYDIPRGSPAYDPHQDGDGDGLACEPY